MDTYRCNLEFGKDNMVDATASAVAATAIRIERI